MLLALYSLWEAGGSPPPVPPVIPDVIPIAPGPTPSAQIQNRLIRLLPSRWWSTPAPIRDAILGGASDVLAQAQALFTYAKAQMRLSTATGFWIDLFSFDYMGLTTQRRVNETDDNYAPRVQKELTRERVTRAGMYQALLDLTGKAPVIVEPWLGGDVGGWDVSWWGWDTPNGAWGDSFNNQVFITVFQSGIGVGVANTGGWDSGYAGWDVASQWIDDTLITGVTQQDILDTINRTKPIGVTVWVRFN